jgi:hypothetical protein
VSSTEFVFSKHNNIVFFRERRKEIQARIDEDKSNESSLNNKLT